jgi:hypothetical protein
MAYLVPSEFVTKMVDAGESKIFMSSNWGQSPISQNRLNCTPEVRQEN